MNLLILILRLLKLNGEINDNDMNTFEVLSIIGSALLIFGAIIGIWIKTVISIAKIQVEIVDMKRDLVQKEIAILLIEKNNKDDHKEIISKIDRLVEKLIK